MSDTYHVINGDYFIIMSTLIMKLCYRSTLSFSFFVIISLLREVCRDFDSFCAFWDQSFNVLMMMRLFIYLTLIDIVWMGINGKSRFTDVLNNFIIYSTSHLQICVVIYIKTNKIDNWNWNWTFLFYTIFIWIRA